MKVVPRTRHRPKYHATFKASGLPGCSRPPAVAGARARARVAQSTRVASNRDDKEELRSLEQLSARYTSAKKNGIEVESKLNAARALFETVAETRRLAKPAMVTACSLGAIALSIHGVAAELDVPALGYSSRSWPGSLRTRHCPQDPLACA